MLSRMNSKNCYDYLSTLAIPIYSLTHLRIRLCLQPQCDSSREPFYDIELNHNFSEFYRAIHFSMCVRVCVQNRLDMSDMMKGICVR